MKFKYVDFDYNKIVFHKKDGEITINKSNIVDIKYVKPRLFNYLLSGIGGSGSTYPGRLEIRLNVKVGKTKLYLVKVKFKEVLTLPDWCLKLIDPANMLI